MDDVAGAAHGANGPPTTDEDRAGDPVPWPLGWAESAGERLRAGWRDELERWSAVSAHLPLTGGGRLGAALALSRRGARFLLRWYINPIVEQQNRFNAAAVSLDALDRAREHELAREIAELRARVAALEAQLAAATPAPPAAGARDPRAGGDGR